MRELALLEVLRVPPALSPGSGVDTGGAATASPAQGQLSRVCASAAAAALTGDSQGISELSLPAQHMLWSLVLSDPALL